MKPKTKRGGAKARPSERKPSKLVATVKGKKPALDESEAAIQSARSALVKAGDIVGKQGRKARAMAVKRLRALGVAEEEVAKLLKGDPEPTPEPAVISTDALTFVEEAIAAGVFPDAELPPGDLIQITTTPPPYRIEANGNMWQSVFPDAEAAKTQNHDTFEDALRYMTEECGISKEDLVIPAEQFPPGAGLPPTEEKALDDEYVTRAKDMLRQSIAMKPGKRSRTMRGRALSMLQQASWTAEQATALIAEFTADRKRDDAEAKRRTKRRGISGDEYMAQTKPKRPVVAETRGGKAPSPKVMAMLNVICRPEGASTDDILTATGWGICSGRLAETKQRFHGMLTVSRRDGRYYGTLEYRPYCEIVPVLYQPHEGSEDWELFGIYLNNEAGLEQAKEDYLNDAPVGTEAEIVSDGDALRITITKATEEDAPQPPAEAEGDASRAG